MKIGFTGTKDGCTEKQLKSLDKILKKLNQKYEYIEWHQGDCIGADADSTLLVAKNGYVQKIITHPPVNSSLRSYVIENNLKSFPNGIMIEVLEERDYLDRNKNIVKACTLLIVCPKEENEILRSGTWATYRNARKLNKNIIVIKPNGSLCKWPDDKLIQKFKRKVKNAKKENATTEANSEDPGSI